MNFTSGTRMMSTTVAASVVLIFGVLIIMIAISGSYLLTWHALNVQAFAQEALRVREMTAQIRTSVPVCHAFQALDNASKAPVINVGSSPISYGHKLAGAIHQVYLSTRCQTLLNDLAHHMSYTQILKQFTGGNHG